MIKNKTIPELGLGCLFKLHNQSFKSYFFLHFSIPISEAPMVFPKVDK